MKKKIKILHIMVIIAVIAVALWAWTVLPEWWLYWQSIRSLEG